MGWLPSFINRKKSPDLHSPSNNPETKNFSTVMQILAEETIMTVAQWLVAFVNRTIQNKQDNQNTPTQEKVVANTQTAPLEELLSKFGVLVEQLHVRDQGIAPLHNRVSEIEAALKQNSDFEQYIQRSSQVIAALEERLMQLEKQVGQINVTAIEASLQKSDYLEQQAEQSIHSIAALEKRLIDIEGFVKQPNSLSEELDQANQTIKMLENRIEHLEELLTRFRIVPKLVERNYRAIASLQNRLEPSKNGLKGSLGIISN